MNDELLIPSKRSFKSWSLVFILSSFIFLLLSCGPDEKIEEQRRAALVEKLFRQEKANMNKEADSLCLEREEEMILYLIDSFKNARIEELKEVSPY